jgi:starch synthase
MNILMAAAEMSPFLRNGELGDAVASLSAELRRQGHEVSVVIPCYRAIREGKSKLKKTGVKFSVNVGPGRFPCEIFELKSPEGVQVFAVARDEYFDRSGVYGVDGRDYQDNAARFIFFTKCVVELARRMEPLPDILHCHSWETALAPVFCRDQRLPFRTVLTPHGLEYQGNFWSYDFGLTNLPGEYFGARGVEYFGSMNCLKGGILFADAVALPGERFSSEAQTPAGGCGLDPVLREHQHKLFGILTPAGLEEWAPGADTAIAAKYTAAQPGKKSVNRTALLKACELAADPARGVFVTFADASPGIDILLASLDRLLTDNCRLVLLGPVDPAWTVPLEVARRKHQGRFAHFAQCDEKLARQALAGADFFLLPGAVEPRATWLRRAIRYGTIPVAHQCGGLFQLVRDFEPERGGGNGFTFRSATADGLVDVARRALRALDDSAQRETLVAANLARDFSHEASAKAYLALYSRLLGRPVSKAA